MVNKLGFSGTSTEHEEIPSGSNPGRLTLPEPLPLPASSWLFLESEIAFSQLFEEWQKSVGKLGEDIFIAFVFVSGACD